MNDKKALFVATVVKTHIMEFHIPYLKLLQEHGWETAVAARNDYDDPSDCYIPYCDTYYDIKFCRNPFRISNLRALKQLAIILKEGNYNIVHCHTPVGAALTRIASIPARKTGTKVIYTAHGFHFYKGASLINWLLYYPTERLLANYTDELITINREDYERAKTFNAKHVHYIPGVGINIKAFNNCYTVRSETRRKLGINNNETVFVFVCRKGSTEQIGILFKQLSSLKKQYKDIKCIVYTESSEKEVIEELTCQYGLKNTAVFVSTDMEMDELYYISDIYLCTAYDSANELYLNEARACGLPSISFDELYTIVEANNDYDNAKIDESIITSYSKRREIAIDSFIKLKQTDLKKYYEEGKIELDKNTAALNSMYRGQKIRKEFGIPLNARCILSVGEVNKNKNHIVGIKALANSHLENTYYIICGRGPLINNYKRIAQSLGVGDKVIFTGYRNDISDFYKAADLFLFPSIREGLPVAVIEAMASGLPVISTNIRGCRELVDQDMLIDDPHDVEGIIKKIPLVRPRINDNLVAIEKYSLENVLNKIKEIYFA